MHVSAVHKIAANTRVRASQTSRLSTAMTYLGAGCRPSPAQPNGGRIAPQAGAWLRHFPGIEQSRRRRPGIASRQEIHVRATSTQGATSQWFGRHTSQPLCSNSPPHVCPTFGVGDEAATCTPQRWGEKCLRGVLRAQQRVREAVSVAHQTRTSIRFAVGAPLGHPERTLR